jgi:hypothetical protein
MGSYDGAETCELVGCYILSILTKKYGQNIGLYRDDGLAAFQQAPQRIERIKKDLCKIFHENDLKITIEANMTMVNFLDATLDLKSGKHWPYSKPGNVPSYVHVKSNHPPTILKNIPEGINKRLAELSSDEECFNKAKPLYQEALNKSGYKYNLSYNNSQQPRKNRPRNITWFNPPFSKNVETNVGKHFLELIDRHFPKSNPLNKIFNRHTLKLSYSCMNNIDAMISSHNKSQLIETKTTNATKNCNCRQKSSCPMERNCQANSIIYQAEVTTKDSKETYVGLCDTEFKLRYNNHQCSFNHGKYRDTTQLSKHIWNLKDQNTEYQIKWKQVKQAKSYTNTSKKCNLCLWEKYYIICKQETATLNKRNELMSECRHSKKFLLNNAIT